MRVETVLRRLAIYEAAGQEALDVLDAFANIPLGSVLEVSMLMASLSGYPARVLDPTTGAHARADPNGACSTSGGAIDAAWASWSVLTGEPPALWLERAGELRVLDAAIFQAAAQAVLTIRGGHKPRPTTVGEFLVDIFTADNPQKQKEAIEGLGLHPASECRVVARPGNVAQILVAAPRGPLAARDTPATALAKGERVGISHIVVARELPDAWAQARLALAFAAAGTSLDPGEQTVRVEDIGVWGDVTKEYKPGPGIPADVHAITALEDSVPFAIQTLAALTNSASVREAAARVFTHHSTMQARQAVVERRLGWNVTTPAGRTRASMALALRRYLLHPPSDEPPVSAFPTILFISPQALRP